MKTVSIQVTVKNVPEGLTAAQVAELVDQALYQGLADLSDRARETGISYRDIEVTPAITP